MVFLVTKAALAATIVGVGVTFGALSYLASKCTSEYSLNILTVFVCNMKYTVHGEINFNPEY